MLFCPVGEESRNQGRFGRVGGTQGVSEIVDLLKQNCVFRDMGVQAGEAVFRHEPLFQGEMFDGE